MTDSYLVSPTDNRRASFFPAESIIFLVVWLALLFVGRERLLRDPGTFWHTVVGSRIIDTHAVVRTDSFSFRHAGQPWLAHQWLGECAMAIIDRISGLDGLLLAAVTLLAATYALAARRLLMRGATAPTAGILVTLAIAASSFHFLVRPHLIGIPLMAATLAILADFESRKLRPRVLIALPLIFLVWANTHGSALGGLATLWLVIAGWTAESFFRRASAPPLAHAYLAAAASTAAIFINPFGTDLPRLWISLLSAPSLPRIIIEHAPLSLTSIDGWMVLLFGAIYVVALVRARRAGLRFTWFVPLIWLALTIQRIRHGPLFAITALIALADILPKVTNSIPTPRIALARASIVPLACVTLALVLQIAGAPIPLLGRNWARLDPTYWPVQSTAALRSRVAESPAAARILNDTLFGGFLIGTVPTAKIWIDDRCELYGEDELNAYVAAGSQHPEQIEAWSDQFDAQTAFVHTNSPFDRHLAASPRWTCRHRSPTAALYARSTVSSASIAATRAR